MRTVKHIRCTFFVVYYRHRMWRSSTKSPMRHVLVAPVTRRRRRALPTDEALNVILPHGYFTTLPRTAISSQVARALTKRFVKTSKF